jgi:hypothetical protein
VHAFADADNLAALLPAAEFVPTRSFRELRLHPDRLIGIMARFAADRWEGPPAAARGVLRSAS